MTSGTINGWPVVSLGTLLKDIQPGFASGRHNSTGEGIPHFRPMNVSTDGRIERTVLKYVDPSAGRPELRLHPGDVVFNNTNSPELVGKTALFEDDDMPAFSNHMTRLRSDPDRLDPGYLALRLHQAWREGWFQDHCNNHVSQASIGRDVLKEFQIELPPMATQLAIAALYSQLERYRASSSNHLEAARLAIGKFRDSVLAAACSGRLTADLRQDQDADNNDMPSAWKQSTVAEVCERVSVGHVGPTSKYYTTPNNGIVFLRSQNVRPGHLILEDTKFITTAFHDSLRKSQLRPGDVLIVRVGANRGDCCMVPQDYSGPLNCANIVFARPKLIDPAFLSLYLRGPGRTLMLHETTGSAQGVINTKAVAKIRILVPPQSEQEVIVQRANRLLELAGELGERVKVATRFVSQTSQSVLAKAFHGELVPASSEPQASVAPSAGSE